MKKTNQLYIVTLLLIMVLSIPAAFVKAKDGETVDNNDNKDQQNNIIKLDNGNDSKGSIQEDNKGDNSSKDAIEKQNKGKDEEKDLKDNQTDQNNNENDQFDGENHKNSVSTFVKTLLDVANKEHGQTGDMIKEIAQEQDTSKDTVASKIDAIQNRSKLKTFLIGTDFKNIGDLRSEMVQTSNQIDKLNKVIDQTTNTTTKATLEDQVKTLETQQEKVGNLLTANENKFSLFGWFVKIFSK